MARPQYLEALKKNVAALQSVDLEKLKRTNLGDESLASELEPRLKKISRLRTLAQYAENVHDSAANGMSNVFSNLSSSMTSQAVRPNQEFIAQRKAFLDAVDGQLEESKQWEKDFIAAAVESRGFLEDEGIRHAYQETIADLKVGADETLDRIKKESDRILAEARNIAEEIEKRARRTAAKVSVQEAQEQFKGAQRGLTIKAILWGGASALATMLFLEAVVYLIHHDLPDVTGWHAFYHAALRISVLSIVGGVTGFCFKTLRAYLHLRERNLHRQRVANSIPSFVDSAVTPEVRDVILAHLVESVAEFGVSGLLTKEHEIPDTPKVPAEFFGRLLGGFASKKEGS